jgi:hypothetical protein
MYCQIIVLLNFSGENEISIIQNYWFGGVIELYVGGDLCELKFDKLRSNS